MQSEAGKFCRLGSFLYILAVFSAYFIVVDLYRDIIKSAELEQVSIKSRRKTCCNKYLQDAFLELGIVFDPDLVIYLGTERSIGFKHILSGLAYNGDPDRYGSSA